MFPGGSCGGVLQEYGVLGLLLRAIRSLYNQSESCIRIPCTESSMFSVGVGLCQGSPLSSILFVIFMGKISRHNRREESVRSVDLRIATLLFADDVVLLASSYCDIQHTLGQFAAECEVGMKVSTSKSEAVVPCFKKGGLLPLGWE